MDKKNVTIILLFIAIVGLSVVSYGMYISKTSPNLTIGTHNILLLCDDPTEDSGTEGIGSVDMAYAIQVTNGKVTSVIPIYPGGLRSQVYTEPSQLGTGMLLLHDSLYGVNTTEGAARAQEIVEYNKGIKTDAVIMITPTAVDALLQTIGPIKVNGVVINVTDSIGFIRNNTEKADSTESRGTATSSLMNPIINAAESNPLNYINLAKVALEQYNAGNIRVVPANLVTQFAMSAGLKSL